MARAPRLTSVFRRRSTTQPQPASPSAIFKGDARAAIPVEALGRVSARLGHGDGSETRNPHQATRAAGNQTGLSGEPAPPGIVIFLPAQKAYSGPTTYPRFIRQLSPNVERLVQPDPITGKWPRLPNLSHAEVDARDPSTREPGLREWELRRTVDWGNRPPSRTAFADWLAASTPVIEEAYTEKAERDTAAAIRPAKFKEAAE
jgi:hypothetical protein